MVLSVRLMKCLRHPIYGLSVVRNISLPAIRWLGIPLLNPWSPHSWSYRLIQTGWARPIIMAFMLKSYLLRPLVWHAQEEERKVNFGDLITDRLMRRLGYQTTRYCVAKTLGIVDKFPYCLEVVGSELRQWSIKARPCRALYIWGQGAGYDEPVGLGSGNVKLLAVRGRRTAMLCGQPDLPVCDPGFLMPYLFPVKREHPAGVLFVPHMIHRHRITEKMVNVGADRYLDIVCSRSAFNRTLQTMVQSEFVLTDSMHAAIICHAYRVPWALCLAMGDAVGLLNKWIDIFDLMGLDPNPEKHIVHNIKEARKWWQDVGSNCIIPDVTPLLKVFPLPIKDQFSQRIIRDILKGGVTGSKLNGPQS